MKTSRCIPSMIAVLAVGELSLCLSAHAADFSFTNAIGGDFTNALNWTPTGVPGAADNANFNSPIFPVVIWGASRTNANAFFNGTSGGIQAIIGTHFWLLTNSFIVGQNSAKTGAVVHLSGELCVTNSAGLAQLVIGQHGKGEYVLNTPTASVVADQLFATNNGASFTNSILLLNAGTLTTLNGSVITQTNDFTIGTVSNATATWNMLGGTNSVALAVGGFVVLGGADGAIGSVLVDGADTVWTNSQTVQVGGSFDNNKLTITNGGTVMTRGLELGSISGSSGNSLLVMGPGSTVTNGIEIDVGKFGSSNQARVTAGGKILTSQIFIGGHFGSANGGSNNLLVVDGSNSLVAASSAGGTANTVPFGGINLGEGGAGNLLLVTNGATLQSASAVIGGSSNALHNTAIISGSGSLWTNLNFDFTVGAFGASNRLVVENGGMLNHTSPVSFVFFDIGKTGDGNIVSVTGPGSRMTVYSAEDIRMGVSGSSANQLIVSNGAFLGTSSLVIGSSGASNLVIVTGSNSVWTNDSAIEIGDSANGNGLIVTNGGTAFGFATMGSSLGATNNFMVVSGPNSIFNGSVDIGSQGVSNRLLVANGGTVRSPSAVLGILAGSDGNSATVDGATSVWSNTLGLTVGLNGSNNRVILTNSGGLVTPSITIGQNNTALANQLTVSGGSVTGTNVHAALNDLIDGWGGGGTLTLSGGSVLTERLTVTNNGVGYTNSVFNFNYGTLATFSRSALVLPSTFFIGTTSNQIATWLMLGGINTTTLTSGNVALGSFAESHGVAVVAGPSTVWSNNQSFVIGSVGSSSQINVTNGAHVFAPSATLGLAASSATNNSITVDGAGSLFNLDGTLTVGNTGGDNHVLVTNSGTVAADTVAIGAQAASLNNRVIVDGGTLRATNSGNNSLLNVQHGTNVLNAGLVWVDHLRVTNTVAQFEFNGGSIITRDVTNNNGRTFFVGNGITPAQLNFVGNRTNNFGNGLTVRNNAQMNGCGIILGALTVQNGGLLSPIISSGKLVLDTPPTLQGEVVMEIGKTGSALTNDQIVVTGTLTYGGKLTVVAINGLNLLAVGDTFPLFNATSYAGGFSSFDLPVLTNGLIWSNSLAIDGSLRIAAAVPVPRFNNIHLSGTNVVISGTNGPTNGTYRVLTSTNVADALATWTPVLTNQFNGSGNFTFSNGISPGVLVRFYLLQVP